MKTPMPNRVSVIRAILATAVMTLSPALALAHGKLERAEPSPDSTVAAPAALRLVFNEPLESAFSNATVLDAKGAAVSKDKAKIDGANPRSLVLAVPPLASGAYSVHWSVMTHDGHKTTGNYQFTVK